MGNTASNRSDDREIGVETFDTLTNSGTPFRISLRSVPHMQKGGIADIWAYVLVDDEHVDDFEDLYVPVHWDSFVYKAAHVGRGEPPGTQYSVMFELGGSRYLHFGAEAGVLYFETPPGEELSEYGVVEQNSSVADPFAVFVHGGDGNVVSKVYLMNQRESVSGEAWKKAADQAANSDDAVGVASELFRMVDDGELSPRALKGSRHCVQSGLIYRDDDPESVEDALKMVADEKHKMSSEIQTKIKKARAGETRRQQS